MAFLAINSCFRVFKLGSFSSIGMPMASGKDNYQFYVLTASSGEYSDGRKAHSNEVAIGRLTRGSWALYANTRNRAAIKKGDRVLGYATGGLFVGTARVADVQRSESKLRGWKDGPLLVFSPASAILVLDEVDIFPSPVEIKPMKDQLEFAPKHKKWGVVLLGGALRISEADWNQITTHPNRRSFPV
jgi:hypothetical protein